MRRHGTRRTLRDRHGEGAVGHLLAQRLELAAELLDPELSGIDASLHGQGLAHRRGAGKKVEQASVDAQRLDESRVQIDGSRGDVGGARLHALHATQRVETWIAAS